MGVFRTLTFVAATVAATTSLAGEPAGAAPGPGIFALLAFGIVGAIGVAKLRK